MDAGLIFIAGLFVVFWLFVIRPQRRRVKQQDEVLAALAVGDEVVTAGGLYGEITALRGDDVRLEIAPGLEVRVARRAIAAVMPEEEEEEEEPGEIEDAEERREDESAAEAEQTADEEPETSRSERNPR